MIDNLIGLVGDLFEGSRTKDKPGRRRPTVRDSRRALRTRRLRFCQVASLETLEPRALLSANFGQLAAAIDAGDPTPPSMPTNLVGQVSGNSAVNLSWSASEDLESGIKEYHIFRAGSQVGTSLTTTFNDPNAPLGATFAYDVTAVNNDGLESLHSAPLSLTGYRDGVSPTPSYAGTQDTYIDGTEQEDHKIFGQQPIIKVDGKAPSDEQAGLIEWDLSGILPGSTVTNASITLNVTNATTQVYELYELKRDWLEGEAHWEHTSINNLWQVAGARGADDRGTAVLGTVTGGTGKVTINLNAAGVAVVQKWVDDASDNHGLIISDPTNSDDLIFDSSEATTTANRPRLVVSYVAAIPTDQTPPLAPTGLAASSIGLDQINLTWQFLDDPESGIHNFIIYRDGVQIGTSKTASFIDAGRIPGRNYSYQVRSVNGEFLQSELSSPLVHHIDLDLAGDSLTTITQDGYLPGIPVLVRLQITGADGKPDREIWDAEATLSVDNPNITMSTNSVRLWNGVGSALVTFTGSGDFNLTASLGTLQISRSLTDKSSVAQTNVSGTLPGTSTNWTGIVHVTGDLTVPVGHTLTIQPGTIVLIDGDPGALSVNGKDITIQGKINSLGTAEQPVTITASNPSAPWGELHHVNSQPSLYQYTNITRGGHSPHQGHTGSGPAIHTDGSTVTFDHSAVSDLAGKIAWASNSDWIVNDSHFSRAIMGPELTGTSLSFEYSYITEMLGIYREDGITDDDDGIYLHGQQTGDTMSMRHSVVARVNDDGIDTANCILTVEDHISRNAGDKGISFNDGEIHIKNTLLTGNDIGIEIKVNGGGTSAMAFIDRTTIVDDQRALRRVSVGSANIQAFVTNSIIFGATDSIFDGGVPQNVHISYSDLGEAWPGAGNITADPMFVDPIDHDFHLKPTSPAIDSGDPQSPADPDGTRADMGAYPYTHQASSSVVGRRIFYNASKYDGNDPVAGASDDAAIAPDKTALLPGGTATFANYTSYVKGINGILVDIAGLPSNSLTADDFGFKVGNNNDPGSWAVAPAPSSIVVRKGAGAGGSDRVELIWPDRAIQKTWLQVTVKAGQNTGLQTADVFYFGDAVGEAGNSASNALVNAGDEIAARNDPHTILNPAPITNTHDYNRDGLVNAQDQIIARNNGTTIISALRLITVPAALATAPPVSISRLLGTSADPRAANSSGSPGPVPATIVRRIAPGRIARATAEVFASWKADLEMPLVNDDSRENDSEPAGL